MTNRLLRVDAEGVPRIVQSMEWSGNIMCFECTLFDGTLCKVAYELVSPDITLLATEPTPKQWAEAWDNIDGVFEKEFERRGRRALR